VERSAGLIDDLGVELRGHLRLVSDLVEGLEESEDEEVMAGEG
jgi:hypothetical protein